MMKNMHLNKNWKRSVALLLAVILVSAFFGSAFAEDDGLDADIYSNRLERRRLAEEEEARLMEEGGWEDDFFPDDDLLLEESDDLDLTEDDITYPVVIKVENLSGDIDDIAIGSVLSFTSEITVEVDWETVTYQWQTSPDGEEWYDVEDATQATMLLTLDESNVGSYWRLIVRD